jgi:hypothetical protein
MVHGGSTLVCASASITGATPSTSPGVVSGVMDGANTPKIAMQKVESSQSTGCRRAMFTSSGRLSPLTNERTGEMEDSTQRSCSRGVGVARGRARVNALT